MNIGKILDKYTTKAVEQRKEKTIATLGGLKYALRIEALAIALFAIKEPSPLSIGLLPLAYLNYEWSMIAANAQDVFKKNSTLFSVMSDQTAYENHLFQYAPLHRTLYRISG